MVRLISLIVLLATWWLISQFVEPQTLPGPERVLGVIAAQMRSGDIFFQLGVTLARVLAAFTIAMAAGTAIGLLMGRVKLADRLGDPWL
ncbi:MAG: ABC transporter permease, partial [Pseudolabrys sp.]